MEKIGDRELLVLSWTDLVVNSSKIRHKKNHHKKSEFLQARVFEFRANVQARLFTVWFLKQSKQMRLCKVHTPFGTTFPCFALNSTYSDL